MKSGLSVFIALMLVVGCVNIAEGESRGTLALTTRSAGSSYEAKIVEGFQEACAEMGYTAVIKEPAELTTEMAIQAVDELISQGVDAIALPGPGAGALAPTLAKANAAGIKIISWDTPVEPELRVTHTSQMDLERIGRAETQAIAEMLGEEGGQIAILNGFGSAAGHDWRIAWVQEELKDPKYENIELVKVVYGDDAHDSSIAETEGLLRAYPELKGIIAPTAVGITAAAEVITDKGLQGQVHLTGLGLPSEMAEYIHNGACQWMYLWNPIDMGYFAAYTAAAAVEGRITGAAGEVYGAGRLGEMTLIDSADGGTEVMLGAPYRFDASNIDEWKDVF